MTFSFLGGLGQPTALFYRSLLQRLQRLGHSKKLEHEESVEDEESVLGLLNQICTTQHLDRRVETQHATKKHKHVITRYYKCWFIDSFSGTFVQTPTMGMELGGRPRALRRWWIFGRPSRSSLSGSLIGIGQLDLRVAA